MASSVARPACMTCCGNGQFCVLFVTVLYIFPQPPLWSWTWLQLRKPTKLILQLYIVRLKILSTFHTRVEYLHVILHIHTNGDANAEKSAKQPFPLEASRHPSNASMPGPTPLTTPNDSSIAGSTSTQLSDKRLLVTMGRLPFIPKTALYPLAITTSI